MHNLQNHIYYPACLHFIPETLHLLLPLQLFGTPFFWPFVVVSPLTVSGANSNLPSISLLSGLLTAPPYPAVADPAMG